MHRLVPVLILISACASSAGATASDTTTPTSSTATAPPVSTTTTPPTTLAVPATTTTLSEPIESSIYDYWRGSFTYGDGLRIDVHAPSERSNHPIAVTVHGGGWYGGRLDSMGRLADGLAERGFVVFNATYRTLARGGTFPTMVEDVACAVAYARQHALDYSTTAHHFTLIGHSAGAHLSSLVALAPTVFGSTCSGGDIPVDAWVGLAGSYDTDIYAFLLEPFFGVPLASDPELWRQGNPYAYVASRNPDVALLFIHGDADEFVPLSMSERIFLAADQLGAGATLVIVPNVGHGEVTSPHIVGDLIADFVHGNQ